MGTGVIVKIKAKLTTNIKGNCLFMSILPKVDITKLLLHEVAPDWSNY